MARRRKRRGGRKSKAIAILPSVPVLYAGLNAYRLAGGVNTGMANRFIQDITGYNMDAKNFAFTRAMPFWTGMLVSVIGHKAANKFGVNKYVRKLTFGYLVL